jgi:putative ABC transport system permease protein
MLTGDRAKYFGLVFSIAFCTFLLENQSSIFANIMRRTASQILDVTDAEAWVMDPKTEYWEQTKALKDTDLTRVRGVPGVRWAVRLFKGNPVAKTENGRFAVSILVGLDDATLAGAPRKMLMGSWQRLREPGSVVIDRAGSILLYPGEPLELGRTLEMNDHRVTIVGISDASAPFVSLPVMHARYSEAIHFLANGPSCPSSSLGLRRGSGRRSSPCRSRPKQGSGPGRPGSSCGTASATTSATRAYR